MKEHEIRNRDAHNKYLELVRRDSEELIKTGTFLESPCPACGCSRSTQQFRKDQFTYVGCDECETIYVNPRPDAQSLGLVYKESESTRFWVNDFFLPVAEARRQKIFRPRAEFIAQSFPENVRGRVADVGAGFGFFLEELRTSWPHAEFTAIEPSVEMAAICRAKGLNVVEAFAESLDPKLHQFDLITCFELFEHLHDPWTFLRRMHALLAPNGLIFMTTLNGLGFDIQVLWSASKAVSPPHHLNFANPHAMKILLERSGFIPVEISTPGQLDWDIVESSTVAEHAEPGRFFQSVIKHGSPEAKRSLQEWIRNNNFSSHMRVVARKVMP